MAGLVAMAERVISELIAVVAGGQTLTPDAVRHSVGMVAGAVIGGVAGAIADNVGKTANAYEILYQVDGTQDVLALVQEKDDHRFKAGDRIRLIEGQFTVRAQPL